LEIRAVEITGSNTGDAPMLPYLLGQIPRNQEIGSVTADGVYDTRRARYGCGDTATSEALSHGSQPPPVPSPGTMRAARHDIWAWHSGETGADTTAGAASRRKGIARNCRASG
jgi:hypothetical protein